MIEPKPIAVWIIMVDASNFFLYCMEPDKTIRKRPMIQHPNINRIILVINLQANFIVLIYLPSYGWWLQLQVKHNHLSRKARSLSSGFVTFTGGILIFIFKCGIKLVDSIQSQISCSWWFKHFLHCNLQQGQLVCVSHLVNFLEHVSHSLHWSHWVHFIEILFSSKHTEHLFAIILFSSTMWIGKWLDLLIIQVGNTFVHFALQQDILHWLKGWSTL